MFYKNGKILIINFKYFYVLCLNDLIRNDIL